MLNGLFAKLITGIKLRRWKFWVYKFEMQHCFKVTKEGVLQLEGIWYIQMHWKVLTLTPLSTTSCHVMYPVPDSRFFPADDTISNNLQQRWHYFYIILCRIEEWIINAKSPIKSVVFVMKKECLCNVQDLNKTFYIENVAVQYSPRNLQFWTQASSSCYLMM